MSVNSVLVYPVQRSYTSGALSAAVKSLTLLNGKLYGITYTTGSTTTQMGVVPILGTTANATLTASMEAVMDITNDGTNLYAVEERTGAAAATTNNIYKITTGGTVTNLKNAFINMRSVVYDPVNACLYASAPFDSKIIKVTGGGIGGNNDAVVVADFITNITNKPGRLWVNEGSTRLYFSTEATAKQIGVVELVAGVADTPIYYDILGSPTEVSQNLIFMEEYGAFIYVGAVTTKGIVTSLSSFSMNANLTYSTAVTQGVLFDDYSFAYADGTTIRYYDISSNEDVAEYATVSGTTSTSYKYLSGWSFTEDAGSPASAVVELRDGNGGNIVAKIKLLGGQSAGEQYEHPIRFNSSIYINVASGTVTGAVYGR